MRNTMYCLIFIIFISTNSYAEFALPKTTFEGNVFVRDDIYCKDISCGTPLLGAKMEFSIKDYVFNDSGVVYTDSSGYFKLTIDGCGKYVVKGTYRNVESTDSGFTVSGRCLLTGEKVVPISWALEKNEIDYPINSGNSSILSNNIEIIFNKFEEIYSEFIYPHVNTTFSDGFYYRKYSSSPVSDIGISMETEKIFYYWNNDWVFFSTLDEANKMLCEGRCFYSSPIPSVTKLVFDKSNSKKIKISTHFKSNNGSAIDKVFWKITSPSGITYKHSYDTKNNYKKGSAYTIRTYSKYNVFDRGGIYSIETYVENENGVKSPIYKEKLDIDI